MIILDFLSKLMIIIHKKKENYLIFNIKPNKLFEKKFNFNIKILSIPFSETNPKQFKLNKVSKL